MGINVKSIKDKFKKRKIRISREILELIIKNAEKEINFWIDEIIRNALLSGRKTIRKEDIEK